METSTTNNVTAEVMWHLLSALPAGEAVDAATLALLESRLGDMDRSSDPNAIPSAVSPAVLKAAGKSAPHSLRHVWGGFTESATADTAVELSGFETIRANVLAGTTPASSAVLPLPAALLNPATKYRNYLPQFVDKGMKLPPGVLGVAVHHSRPGGFGREIVHKILTSSTDFNDEDLRRVTAELYPYGKSPFDLTGFTPDALKVWKEATLPAHRPGLASLRVLGRDDIHKRARIHAKSGPGQVDRVISTLGEIEPDYHVEETGGRLFINPWLKAAVLHKDLHCWGELLDCKPIAGRLLGAELLERVGADPAAWVMAVHLLLDWDGTLAEWLETVEGLA